VKENGELGNFSEERLGNRYIMCEQGISLKKTCIQEKRGNQENIEPVREKGERNKRDSLRKDILKPIGLSEHNHANHRK